MTREVEESTLSADQTRLDAHHANSSSLQHRVTSSDFSSRTTRLESSTTHFAEEFTAFETASSAAVGGKHKTQGEKLFADSKSGVYFRRESAQFGAVAIGSLTRTKIELCNATDNEVTVYIGDPALPFVLLHNEVRLRARSYMRIPVRFVPVSGGEYREQLVAQTAEGDYHTTISLSGFAHA